MRADPEQRLRAAFAANASDLLAYLERRIDPRAEAADVLGEAMFTAWKKVRKLPEPPVEARMWLFAIARNTLFNHRRSLGRYSAAVEKLRGSLIDEAATSEHDGVFERLELQQAVAGALAALGPVDAELVRLINWDGFTLAEVARLEGLSASTVRSRYATALRRVEELLPPGLTEHQNADAHRR